MNCFPGTTALCRRYAGRVNIAVCAYMERRIDTYTSIFVRWTAMVYCSPCTLHSARPSRITTRRVRLACCVTVSDSLTAPSGFFARHDSFDWNKLPVLPASASYACRPRAKVPWHLSKTPHHMRLVTLAYQVVILLSRAICPCVYSTTAGLCCEACVLPCPNITDVDYVRNSRGRTLLKPAHGPRRAARMIANS